MPPTTALLEARRKALTDSGFDPDKFDFNDSTGEVFPRPAPPSTSLLGTVGAHALSNIPEAAVGLGGAALGSAIGGGLGVLGGPLAPVTVPVGGLLGGIAGGFIAPSVAEPALAAAKQAILPQAAQDYLTQSAQEHPYGAQGGALLSQLVGLKPSLSNISKMGSGVRSLAGGVPWSRLSAAQRGGLLNVPIGAAIGGGVDLGQQLTSGEPIDPAKVALSTAGGALFTQPNRLAQKFLRMHPVPNETAIPLTQSRDMQSPAYQNYMTRMGISQGTDVQFRPEVTDDAGVPVAGRQDPGATPQDFGLAQISTAAGFHDTAPHELIHHMIRQLRGGSPAEQGFLERALAQVANDPELMGKYSSPEEALTQLAGEIFSGRMAGSKKYSGLMGDLGALFKDRFLRRATPVDHARLLANILQRQGALADRGVPPINLPPSPEAARQSVSPELAAALRDSGFGDVPAEDIDALANEIQQTLAKDPSRVKAELKKATAALDRQRQLLTVAPDDAARQSISESINQLERKVRVLENSRKFVAKVQEAQLGGGRPFAEPTPEPEQEIFEGAWKPTPEPTPEPGPASHAPWETQGGDYPQPDAPRLGRPIVNPTQKATPSSDKPSSPVPLPPTNPRPDQAIPAESPAGKSIASWIESQRGVPKEVQDYGNEPQYQAAKRKKALPPEPEQEGGANIESLIELLRNRQDAGDTGFVTGRELIQNAADAVYSTHPNDPDKRIIRHGSIEPARSKSGKPEFVIDDTGGGMSPEFIASKYLSMGTSGKKVGEGGGLGIAKGQFFGNSEGFEVVSDWRDPATGELIRTTLTGDSGDAFIRAQRPFKMPKPFVGMDHEVVPGLRMKVDLAPTDHEPGTQVRILMKDEEPADQANSAAYSAFNYLNDIKHTTISKHTTDAPLKGYDENQYTRNEHKGWDEPNFTPGKFVTTDTHDTPNATIKIQHNDQDRVEPRRGVTVHYLSNGLYQFSGWQGFRGETVETPGDFIINIKAKVKGNSAGYPFSVDRKSVTNDIKEYVEDYINQFAEREKKRTLAQYAQARQNAPRLAYDPSLVALDVAQKIPPDVMNQLTNDNDVRPITNTLKRIQNAITSTLTKLYPSSNFGNYDFMGILTGTAEAYGVRFGATADRSYGQIYLDPFLTFEMASKESAKEGTGTPGDVISRWLGKLVGIATHENLHQEIHVEGEELARGLTFKAGDVVLDSGPIMRLVDEFNYNPALVKAVYGKLEEYNALLGQHRDAQKSGAFIVGSQESSSRYQRFGATRDQLGEVPKRSRNPLAGEATKLESGGTQDHVELARSFRELYDQRRANTGKYANPIIGALESLSADERERVYATLLDERRARTSLRNRLSTPAEQSAYDAIRNTLRVMAADQQRAGQPVWENGVPRQRGMDPWYAPNVIDSGVRRILAEGPGTQAFADLKADFIRHQMQNGRVSAAEAEKRFTRLLGTFAKSAAGNPFDFNAVRIQQGFGLPDSWIEKNAVKAFRGYTSAFSRDRASWDVLEKDPVTMRRLGSDYYAGDQRIPATVTAHNLSRDPSVQYMTEDFMGRNTADEPFISGASRLGSALIIGNPYVKIADIITTPFKALGMSAKGHGITDVISGIFHTPEGIKNALSTGLNRAGGLVVAHDILGFGEEANTQMVRAAEALTKYSGAEWLEKFSRGVSQAIGEMQGQTYQRLAAQGDAKAIEFLRKLNATPQISKEELGTRIAQIYQGRYDATNMPHWFSHGKMAPFVGLLRWSAEQTNNFNRFAIEPAKRGDFRPAIVSLLGGLTGGLLINEIRERVSGKKAYTASWAELAAGRGKPGEADAIAYKLLSAAQVTGTAGLLSELVKQSYELLSGRSPQGYNFPALNIAGDVTQRVMEAARAIGEGEDAGRVIAQVTQDVLKQNIQAYKLLRTNLGRLGVDKNAQYELNKANENRDLSTWQRMEGKETPTPIRPKIDYTRLGEQEFDRGTLQDAARSAPGLIRDAIAKSAGDPAEMQKRLTALRSIKSFGMPSPTSNPLDFAKYAQWLRATKGPEEANRVTKEFITRSATDQAKRQLIPAFHAR